nr:MAG TPA: hypothetical protein [Caudoviricetes sp.]
MTMFTSIFTRGRVVITLPLKRMVLTLIPPEI